MTSADSLRILLIEDSDQLAGSTARELQGEYGHSVTWLRDPTCMEPALSEQRFDVAIIDLLYEHLNQEFDAKRRAHQVKVRGDRLLISGLTAIRILRERHPEMGIVVWTSGEANRRLHLLYSHENLAMRSYCSKSPGTGRSDALERAARLAHKRQQFVDPVLNPYLPRDKARRSCDILLQDASKRAIWRAIAIGADTRSEISGIAGYSARTVGNRIPEMYQDLLEFDAGLAGTRSPFIEIARYADRNWPFFLDDAVRVMYP
jgi:DNA-binding NarL/FixJ family response regulator